MATTILPKKTQFEQPMATDDEHHQQMTNDPTVQQFPQGGSFGNSSFGSTPPVTNSFGAAPLAAASNFGAAPVTGANMQAPQTSTQITMNQSEMLKSGGGAMQEGADVLVKNDNTDWINKKWRPMMGWIYMATCTADFVVFPILWSVLQALSKGNVTQQWNPLTLQGAGLYHIAMRSEEHTLNSSHIPLSRMPSSA